MQDTHWKAPFCSFEAQLQIFQAKVMQANPEGRSLQADFLELQQFFQTAIAAPEDWPVEAAMLGTIRSVQTEMNRAMRLLGMDIAFLQTAKQAIAQQQRQAQTRDRIAQLLTYCQGIQRL